ncbi:hypothetical protein KXS07_14410 [Inquilinus limosus]|uniref:hypothetical protein n=1 Tax=Inquilinus limosus TaxID=171674 RepID=UPI003F173D3F
MPTDSDEAKETRAVFAARRRAHDAVKTALDTDRLREDIDPRYLAELERTVAQLYADMLKEQIFDLSEPISRIIHASRQQVANDTIDPTA